MRANKQRFSRATVQAELQSRVDAIQAVRRFDPNNGYAQVRGKAVEWAVAYGEYRALLDLASELELCVYPKGRP